MKTTSKILSILLVLAMVLSIAPFAFAAETATYQKIDRIADLTAGTYKMGGYLESYEYNSGNEKKTADFSDAPYHMWDGNTKTASKKTDLVTVQYAFNGGVLTGKDSASSAADVEIVAVEGEANTYYIKCGDKYLCTTEKANRKLNLGTEPAKWVVSNHSKGGIILTSNDVSIGTAGAASNLLRSYTDVKNLQYGVVFFKLSAGTEGGNKEDNKEDTTVAPELKDISVALAGANDASFKVKGVVTCVDGSNIYLQDATGAICARMSEAPTDIKLGDTIIAVGKKAVFNGLPQLGSATYEKSTGLTLSAKETTIGALIDADICTYVSLKDLEVTEVYDNNGAYSAPNITVKDAEGKTIQLYKAVVEKKDGAWTVKVGDVIDVKAAVSTYNKLQLRNTSADEIVVHEKDTTTTPEHEHKLTKVEKVDATTEQEGCKEHYKCECGKLFTDAEGKNETTAKDLVIAKLTNTTDKKDDTTDKKDDTTDKKDDVKPGKTELKPISKAPVAETGYKFGLYNKHLNKTLYFSGEMNGYYLGTTTDASKAANVYLETVEGGYKLYFKDAEGKKQYIEIYTYENNGSTKVGVHLTDNATNIYTWNAELKVLVSHVLDDDYYLGTYLTTDKNTGELKTYETMSASKTSYITGDNASKIGDTQYPAYLYAEVNVSTGDNTNLFAIVAIMVVAMAGMAVIVTNRKSWNV